MCATVRRASRALTQLYDETLRPLGLRATQFTILQVCVWPKPDAINSTTPYPTGKRRKHCWGVNWETSAGATC